MFLLLKISGGPDPWTPPVTALHEHKKLRTTPLEKLNKQVDII
jgi:hypothetical protein